MYRHSPPVAIQILVPTPFSQQVPSLAGFQVFSTGAHWIQGIMALAVPRMLSVTMMNQTKRLTPPVVSLNRVTANAVLVHAMAVIVTVARLLRMMRNLARLESSRFRLCRPSLNSLTRMVVRMFVAMMANCFC